MPIEPIRLTVFALSGGCAAKVGPGELGALLGALKSHEDPRVLVDMRTSDDAGVIDVGRKKKALVHTIDVITPIVDDPRSFGRVSATNAVSDIYAMGGVPTSAVAFLGLPKELPREVVVPILEGAEEVLIEAGAPLIGGHTVKDKELKLGFAVTGWVNPKKMVTNAHARPGQKLLLTKALGTGVLFQAMKVGERTREEEEAVILSMTTLNRHACEVMVSAGVRAGTDVTGFGLGGHAINIAKGSHVDLVLDANAIPALPGVMRYLERDIYPATTNANLEGYGRHFVVGTGVAERTVRLVADPQTSGGILMAVDEELVPRIRRKLPVFVIGEVQKALDPLVPSVRLHATRG